MWGVSLYGAVKKTWAYVENAVSPKIGTITNSKYQMPPISLKYITGLSKLLNPYRLGSVSGGRSPHLEKNRN